MGRAGKRFSLPRGGVFAWNVLPGTYYKSPTRNFFGLEILSPICKFGKKILSKFMKYAAHSGGHRFKLVKICGKNAAKGR